MLTERDGWAPRGLPPGFPGKGTELSRLWVEVLGLANHLNGHRLLRDRLYSLIEFALKCNLIFSETGLQPLSYPPPKQTRLSQPTRGSREPSTRERGEGLLCALC